MRDTTPHRVFLNAPEHNCREARPGPVRPDSAPSARSKGGWPLCLAVRSLVRSTAMAGGQDCNGRIVVFKNQAYCNS